MKKKDASPKPKNARRGTSKKPIEKRATHRSVRERLHSKPSTLENGTRREQSK